MKKLYKDKIIGAEEYQERFYQSDTDSFNMKMRELRSWLKDYNAWL